jgi:MerR family transcriptional regulator, light-induced transcriptional regulator
MACLNPNFMGAKFRLEIDGARPGSALPVRCRGNDQAAAFEIKDEWDRSRVRLEHAIETEILPRLLMMHMKVPPTRDLSFELFEADEVELNVETFADLIMRGNVRESVVCIEALLTQGTSLRTIYLELLAPTARHIGKCWDEDLYCFTDITVGLTHLHQVICRLGQSFTGAAEYRKPARRAIINTLPFEQHTFGLDIVADCFRHSGWEVAARSLDARDRLDDLVRDEPFHLFGLSVSNERQLDRAASTIHAIRRTSHNRAILIMVGGRVFDEHPERAEHIGADATAKNGFLAVEYAENLLALMASQ